MTIGATVAAVTIGATTAARESIAVDESEATGATAATDGSATSDPAATSDPVAIGEMAARAVAIVPTGARARAVAGATGADAAEAAHARLAESASWQRVGPSARRVSRVACRSVDLESSGEVGLLGLEVLR